MNLPDPTPPHCDRFWTTQALPFALACAACLVLDATDPENWMSLEEYGPFQNLQVAALAAALALNIWAAVRAQGTARAACIFILGFTFFLFWRELDLDKELAGARMFSWTYLDWSADKMPLATKLLLGGASIGLTVAYLGYLLVRARRVRDGIRERFQPAVVCWGAIAFLLLALAQLWDKASMIYRHMHITIRSPEDKDPFDEEALELLGELAWLLFVWALVRAVPSPPREAWNSVRDWFATPAGRRLRQAAGLLLAAAGCAALAWSLHTVFNYQPAPIDYRFTIETGPVARTCDYAYLGLTRIQIAILGLSAGLGLGAAGAGVLLALGAWRVRPLAAAVLVALAGAAVPFLRLTPSGDRAIRFDVSIARPLAEAETDRIVRRLEPRAAMNTWPDELLRRFRFEPGDGIQEFGCENTPGGFQLSLRFSPQADTRRRMTLMEFYAQYTELLARDLALGPAAAQEPWTRYDAPPIQGSLWPRYTNEWLDARNAERAAGRTP